jgi:hypothetical protein
MDSIVDEKARTVSVIRIMHDDEQAEPVKTHSRGGCHSFHFRDRRCAEWFASVLSGCFPVAESAPSIVEECAK